MHMRVNKKPLPEEATTAAGTQAKFPAHKLEKQVRGIHLKLNNVIRASPISKVGRFQASNIKTFWRTGKR